MVKQHINSDFSLYFKSVDIPFNEKELDDIEKIVNSVSFTPVKLNDKYHLSICGLRNDEVEPTDLHPSSSDLLKIINSEKMQIFYQKITGFEAVCIRRCQINCLEKGGFVGYHSDAYGNSEQPNTHIDYALTVVLQLRGDFEGGETILYKKNQEEKIAGSTHSMLVLSGELPHEVLKVTQGIRKTLVYFLSENFGACSD